MCCKHKNHHENGHHSSHQSGSCGCSKDHELGPSFWTRNDKIAWLETYLENIQAEAASIKERIDALKSEG